MYEMQSYEGCIEKNSELVSVVPLRETCRWSKGLGKVCCLHEAHGHGHGNQHSNNLLNIHICQFRFRKSNNFWFCRKLRKDWAAEPKVCKILRKGQIYLEWLQLNFHSRLWWEQVLNENCFQIWELSLSLEPAGRYPSPPLPVKSVRFCWTLKPVVPMMMIRW